MSDSKSVLDLKWRKYHIAEIKIIKGSNFINKFGIKVKVRIKGRLRPKSKSLKNSISSNKFNIIPIHKNIKITLIIVLINNFLQNDHFSQNRWRYF